MRKPTARQGPTLKSKMQGWGKGRKPKAKIRKPAEPQIPHHSRTPLPEPGPCARKLCKKEVCAEHCKVAGGHKIDWGFAGWAKGHDDGRFDVSCKLCGAIGTAIVKLQPKEVLWV
jgi:hypothetical protein